MAQPAHGGGVADAGYGVRARLDKCGTVRVRGEGMHVPVQVQVVDRVVGRYVETVPLRLCAKLLQTPSACGLHSLDELCVILAPERVHALEMMLGAD